MKVYNAVQLFYWHKRGSRGHLENIRRALVRFQDTFGNREIHSISQDELGEWGDSLRKKDGTRYAWASLGNILAPVKALFLWCKEKEITFSNAGDRLPSYSHVSTEPKAVPADDFEVFLRAIPKFARHRGYEPIDVRDAAICSLAADCAGRLTALWSVEMSEIKKALVTPSQEILTDGRFESIVSTYRFKSRGKGLGKMDDLRFYDVTAVVLRHYLRVRPDSSCRYVFISHQPWKNFGGQLSRNSISKAFLRICKFAGIKPFRSHAVRHRTLTDLVLDGTDINTVAKYANHTDPLTTMRHYIHINDTSVSAAGARLSANRFSNSSGDGLAREFFNNI